MARLDQQAPLSASPIWLATASNDRGMQDLLRSLPDDPARRAARAILDEEKPLVICTGFPVNGGPETDGPPGAIALLEAFRSLGKRARIASWREALEILAAIVPDLDVIEVATGTDGTAGTMPAHGEAGLITVEICGRCFDGTYRNMHGIDVSDQAPRFEAMFGVTSLVSFGDGGNEFGMGSAPEWLFERFHIRCPISTSLNMVPASVSNYGVYAVIKELEWLTEKRLLPDPAEHVELIERLVAAGCVDGFTGEAKLAVDGQSLHQTEELLRSLIALNDAASVRPTTHL